jgi:hypothetical protein
MVDPYEVVLGVLALAIMVCVPILCVVLYDLTVGRWDDNVAHWREVRKLGRTGTPIERVAADLRRLRAAVRADGDRSATHQIADRLAYDEVLIQACVMLGIEHELNDELTGLERDIERFRLEASLEGAGLVLNDSRRGQPR